MLNKKCSKIACNWKKTHTNYLSKKAITKKNDMKTIIVCVQKILS
jgi:hypothetical protein